MEVKTDEVLPPWLWHGQDVYSLTTTLAAKWAKSPQAAAMWLGRQPGMDANKVIAWTRVMKEVVGSAADRNAPTAAEIQDVVRFAVRRGW